MYWLNDDEKKVVAKFFAEQFANARVVRNDDGVTQKVFPYTLEKTSVLANELGNCLEGIDVELTAFARNINDIVTEEFGRVYAAWYREGGSFVGTFYLSGVGDDPVSDCTIQASLLAGEESSESLDVHELGEWVVEQIVYVIKTEQFDGNVAALFDAIRRELSTL